MGLETGAGAGAVTSGSDDGVMFEKDPMFGDGSKEAGLKAMGAMTDRCDRVAMPEEDAMVSCGGSEDDRSAITSSGPGTGMGTVTRRCSRVATSVEDAVFGSDRKEADTSESSGT